jgi:hypothetical protein
MRALLVEIICPDHGLERFRIKVKRKFNMPKNSIILKFRSKPHKEVSCILVGRNVTRKEIEKFVLEYLQKDWMYNNLVYVKPI